MDIGEQLRFLYESNAENVRNLLRNPEYVTEQYIHEGPFLINPWVEEYAKARYKILIIGKQTDGWTWEENREIDIKVLIEKTLKLYKDYQNGHNESGRMFWRAFSKIVSALNGEHNYLSAIWGNLWKYDQFNYVEDKVIGPSGGFREALLSQLNILEKEIEICKPDAVIFFTSNHLDRDLCRQLKDISHKAFNDEYAVEEFSRCAHPVLPRKSYRTYHPDYLLHWRSKENGERYGKILDLIIKDIRS